MSARASASTTSQGQGPYFAHDVLEPKGFSNKFRQPVGAPCPTGRTPPVRDYRDEEELGDERADMESNSELPAAVIAPKPKLLKSKLPSSASKKEYKRVRVAGGRAPMAKKVTWELDSDDEIIVDMKQQNATDKEVADRLVSEGRTRYHPKTISSRWIRLRRVLAQREDELLDEELTDWHEGEDECLYDAYDMADEEILQELDKVRNKRWEYVAQNLRRLKATARYSQKACKERYEALEAGTARIPPELDDDPAARAEEREAKRAAKAQAKLDKEKKKEEAQEAARLLEEQAAIEAEMSRKAKLEVKERRAEEKTAAAYQGAEERAAKQRAKAEAAVSKREAAAARKEESEFALEVRKAEKEERELQAKADKEEQAAQAKVKREQKVALAKAKKEQKVALAKAAREAKAVQAKADREAKAVQAKAEKAEKARQAKAEKAQQAKAAREKKAMQAKAKKQQDQAKAKEIKKTHKKDAKDAAKAIAPAKQGVKRKAQSAAPVKGQPAKKKLKSATAPSTASKASGGPPAPQQAQ